jgi:hypothetical protein
MALSFSDCVPAKSRSVPPALAGADGLRLMLIKLVCLNLNRRDTRQQPVPAYRSANRANKKAASERIYHCVYPVQQCLYISWNVCSHLCTDHELHSTQYAGCYIVLTCLYDSKRVHNSINMYIHVWTMYIKRLYLGMYIPCTYHVNTCIYICRNVYTCMYMFRVFNICIYHVCKLLYYSIVHRLYIHGTDMSVHVYAMWSGFQMQRVTGL